MEFVALQILTSIGVFISLITFSYLPYCIIHRRSRNRSNSARRKDSIPVLSLANCFAAGVFLATCFLGMVPHVRQHVLEWSEKHTAGKSNAYNTRNQSASPHGAHTKHNVPWTELFLMGGFLMVLLLEELINMCQRIWGRGSTEKHQPTRICLSENEPLMADGECGSGQQGLMGNGDKGTPDSPLDLLRMSDMDSPLRVRGSHSSNSDHHSHNHDHGHHHHVDAGLLLSEGGRSLSWRSVALLLGLSIHGVFEGVALGLQYTSQALFSLLFGVMSHEALCAMAFGINLASHHASPGIAFLTSILFSLTIPFGMATGTVVSRYETSDGGSDMVRISLEGLAAGTFVYVAFMDMLAHELSGHGHGHGQAGSADPGAWRLFKVFCVCAGFLLFFGLTFIA